MSRLYVKIYIEVYLTVRGLLNKLRSVHTMESSVAFTMELKKIEENSK